MVRKRNTETKKQRDNLSRFHKLRDAYNKRDGVRVGDWVKELDGRMSRVTYIWRDENDEAFLVQTGGSKGGQFFLGSLDNGGAYVSYSGSLEDGVDLRNSRLVSLGYERLGKVWIWDSGFSGAGRGVVFWMDFRVFEEVKR